MELMVLLDHGLHEAIRIEEKLDEYDDKLQVSGEAIFYLWLSAGVKMMRPS